MISAKICFFTLLAITSCHMQVTQDTMAGSSKKLPEDDGAAVAPGSGRAAVVLFGLSYQVIRSIDSSKKSVPAYNVIDFQESVANYQEYIFSYLKKAGLSVDVFFATNGFNKYQRDKLLDTYKPVKYQFQNSDDSDGYVREQEMSPPTAGGERPPSNSVNFTRSPVVDGVEKNAYSGEEAHDRRSKILSAVQFCLDWQEQQHFVYDRVIVTRFDLLFKEDFSNSSIDWTKINIVSELDQAFRSDVNIASDPDGEANMKVNFYGNRTDDNFYALPGQLLKTFFGVLHNNQMLGQHKIGAILATVTPVHFIKNERIGAAQFSWFKIVRLCHVGELQMTLAGTVPSDTLMDTTDTPGCKMREDVCRRHCLRAHNQFHRKGTSDSTQEENGDGTNVSVSGHVGERGEEIRDHESNFHQMRTTVEIDSSGKSGQHKTLRTEQIAEDSSMDP